MERTTDDRFEFLTEDNLPQGSGVTALEGESEGEDENQEVEPVSLNDEFPFEELPPPFVVGPLFSCSEVVRVRGVLKGAMVRVLAEGTEIGSAVSVSGSAAVEVRPLRRGEAINAVQEFGGDVSSESFPGLTVLPHPKRLLAPSFKVPVYECSRFVALDGCFVGARLFVSVDGVESGPRLIKSERQGFFVPRTLRSGQRLEARITLCEEAEDETLEAFTAQAATVRRAPNPVPQARIDENSITIGNDRVVVADILYNSRQELVEVRRGASFSYNSSYDASWFILPSGFLIETGDQYSVRQHLCTSSPISPTIQVDGNDPKYSQLPAPVVRGPVCPGDTVIRVSGCRPGAVVVVFAGSSIVTLATADQTNVVLKTSPNRPFSSGERISALQYIGNVMSPRSRDVTVSGTTFVEIEIEGNRRHVSIEGEAYEGVLDEETSALRVRAKTCCGEAEGGANPSKPLW